MSGGYFDYDATVSLQPGVTEADQPLRWDRIVIGIETADVDTGREIGGFTVEDGVPVFSPDEAEVVVITVSANNESVEADPIPKRGMPDTVFEVGITVVVSLKNERYITELYNAVFGFIEAKLARNRQLVHPVTNVAAADDIRFSSGEAFIEGDDSTFFLGLATETWNVYPKQNGLIEISTIS